MNGLENTTQLANVTEISNVTSVRNVLELGPTENSGMYSIAGYTADGYILGDA